MSLEEDTELRDLVVKALETNGILPKLKAQLRASVFLALEEENSIKDKIPLRNNAVSEFLQNKNGRLLLILVHNLLEHLNLEYTRSVFEVEAQLTEVAQENNEKLMDDIQIDHNADQPLLYNILLHTLKTTETAQTSSPLPQQPITEIRTIMKHNQTFVKEGNSNNSSPEFSFESSVEDPKSSTIQEEVSEEISSNFLIDFDQSIQQTVSPMPPPTGEIIPNLLDQTYDPDKNKPLSSLSSLQDLPPLNLTKNRANHEALLLPSLFNKSENRNATDIEVDENAAK